MGQEVFERSAFVGQGGSLAVTSVPELERRIAALVSSGEEDVSFSQAEGQLREWLNRRKVNKSVGLIPRLEGELAETGAVLSRLEEANRTLSRLEGEKAELEGRKTVLEAEPADPPQAGCPGAGPPVHPGTAGFGGCPAAG